MQYGASYFLAKPFDYNTALKVINDFSNPRPAQRSQVNVRKNKTLDERIANLFISVGIPAHIKGYQFLRDAILLTMNEPEYINAVTKRLYPEIAKKNGTTASRVERAIRHAIEVAWDRGDVDTLNSYFGYTIHNLRGKPTNSEFIAMIADCLSLRQKQGAMR